MADMPNPGEVESDLDDLDPEQTTDYLDDEAEDIKGAVDLASQADAAEASLDAYAPALDILSSPLMMDAQSANVEADGMEDEGGDALDTQKAARDEVLETKAADASPKTRGNTYVQWIGAVVAIGGLASRIGFKLYSIFSHKAKNKPDPEFAELTPDQQRQVEALAKAWVELSPPALWASIADYCRRENLTFATQILMLNDIKNLAASAVDDQGRKWTWRGTDYSAKVTAIANAYISASGNDAARAEAMYLALSSLQYDGYVTGQTTTIPTIVGADLAQLSLVQVLQSQAAQR